MMVGSYGYGGWIIWVWWWDHMGMMVGSYDDDGFIIWWWWLDHMTMVVGSYDDDGWIIRWWWLDHMTMVVGSYDDDGWIIWWWWLDHMVMMVGSYDDGVWIIWCVYGDMVTTSLDVCHCLVRDNRNVIVHRPNQLFHGKLPLTVDAGLLDVVRDEGVLAHYALFCVINDYVQAYMRKPTLSKCVNRHHK